MIQDLIIRNYKSVSLFDGMNLVYEILLKDEFVIVKDELGSFKGVLTIEDYCSRDKKLVADCLCEKPTICISDSVSLVYDLMYSSGYSILAVVNDFNGLEGILKFKTLSKYFKEKDQRKSDIELSKSARSKVLEKIKTDFLYNISHELRTPLNAIQGFTELILMDRLNGLDKATVADIIRENTENLVNLVSNITEMLRLGSDRSLVLNRKITDINDLFGDLQDEIKSYQKWQHKENVKIYFKNGITVESALRIDYFKVRQVLFAVLHNALKFTDKGVVKCGARLEGDDKLVFYVMDTGIGISPDKINKIFYAFSKIDNNKTFYQGLGLGLTLCKKVTENMGGKINVKSKPNCGTTVYITIPIKSE